MPALAEVRQAVQREWLAARRKAVNEQFYQRLRARYTVVVEQPQAASDNVPTWRGETRWRADATRDPHAGDRARHGRCAPRPGPRAAARLPRSAPDWPETFAVLWKVPARDDLRLGLYLQLPDNCTPASEPLRFQTADAYTERATLACAGGLEGRRIAIDGLTATLTDVLVRLVRVDGSAQSVRLTPSARPGGGGGPEPLPGGGNLPPTWRRAHPDGRGSPVVRPGTAADRA